MVMDHELPDLADIFVPLCNPASSSEKGEVSAVFSSSGCAAAYDL